MKNYLKFWVVLFFVIFFSGCSLTGGGSSGETGGTLKSSDGGISWELKNKVNDKQNKKKKKG